MKLTRNEKQLLNNINTEPARIEDYCFWLKWKVNFGKGVLGSLNKKGLVESESRTSFGGWEFSGSDLNIEGAENNIILGLAYGGVDIVESLNIDNNNTI